jgi:hypothetical protein
MAQNAENVRIYGSDDDAVSLAASGTALPTIAAVAGTTPIGFVDAGWIHTDGITFGGDTNVERFRGHQGGRVIRVKITESNTTIQWQCLETTALTLGLQLNIKSKATALGVTSAVVSSGRKVERRAIVVDTFDADVLVGDDPLFYRYTAEVEVAEREEFVIASTDMTGYTFTAEVMGDFNIITNDPAFAVEA